MAKKKVSVTLEESVASEARLVAKRRGQSLSAWLNEAAERMLILERGRAAMAEWEAEYGPPSEEAIAWADSALQRVGIAPSDRP